MRARGHQQPCLCGFSYYRMPEPKPAKHMMPFRKISCIAFLLPCHLVLLAGALPAAEIDKTKLPPPATQIIDFQKDIQPIFKASCLSCHKPDKKKGKLDMSTYADLMKGGKQGSPVKAGDPAKSLIVEVISGSEPEMPEKGDPLKAEQVELISRWIKEGAKKN